MKRGRYGLIPRTESAYDVLGLDKTKAHTYSDAEISRAYRKCSLSAHPDKPSGSQAAFDRLQEAYDLVKTEEKRKLYAQYGSRMEEGPGDHMRETMALAVPVSIGLIGGVSFTLAYAAKADRNLLSIIVIGTLGTGTMICNESPALAVLKTSAGGIAVGSALTTLVFGVGMGLSWLSKGIFRRKGVE